MRLFHALVALAVVLALSLPALAADKAAKKAAKQAAKNGLAGQITAVQKDSITIKTVATKKNPTAPVEEKKFTLSDTTKFEKAAAEKGAAGTPATFADVKQGDTVAVFANGTAAEKVVISAKKKKAK